MIGVDSCKVNYQTLLINYLTLILRIVKHAWREKTECKFIGLKSNRLNAKECKETSTEPIN